MSDATVALLVSETKSILTESLVDGNLSTNEILNIAMFVAQKVSSIVNLSYDEKKALVIKIVDASLKEHLSPSQFDQTGARVALDMLPTVFDIAMNAASGKLDLSAKGLEKVATSCLPSCLSLLKANVPSGVVTEVKKVVDSAAVRAVLPDAFEASVDHVLRILEPVPPQPPSPLVSHVSSAVPSYESSPVALPPSPRAVDEPVVVLDLSENSVRFVSDLSGNSAL